MEEVPVIWSKLEQPAQDRVPSKRSGQTLTVLGGSVAYLFGGIDLKNPPAPNNDLYSVDLNPKDLSWTRVEPATAASPPARWRHTATAISKTQLLIFGGFHTSTSRLNDLWVFDSTTRTWLQPVVPAVPAEAAAAYRKRKVPKTARDGAVAAASATGTGFSTAGAGAANQPAGGDRDFLGDIGVAFDDPLASDANPDAPTPRGAHSAVVIGEHLYIFGGYGGVGYQRRDFNDLHRLHVPTMTWVRTDAAAIAGSPPEPRSGHSACACQASMLVFGGWSSTSQFNDLHVLDTERTAWSKVDAASFGPARWNHAAISIAAVPHWQMFVFGGSGTDEGDGGSNKDKGDYLGDILVLDAGSMRWTDLTNTANSKEPHPRPRADSSLVYDQNNKRIVAFGGWANRWFNDCWALPVSSLIGPPYAVLGISPAIGPITGGQTLLIDGEGFDANAPANVRFISGKKFVEATGTCLSSARIEVITPRYDQFGPGNVDVRVSMRGSPYTITSKPYTYFNVADAHHTFAFGPGILDGCVSGVPAVFYIQARDTANSNRTTGQDVFKVGVVRLLADGSEGKEPQALAGLTVTDEDNGSYLVTYTPSSAGKYKIAVEFTGTYGGPPGHIRGSPFLVSVNESGNKDNNKFGGPLVWEAARELVEQASAVSKQTLDGITREVPGDNLDVLLNVKNHLHGVVSKDPEVRLKFDTAQAILQQLKREGARKDKEIMTAHMKLDKGLATWEECKKQSPVCKAAIAPAVKSQSAQTRKDIESFEQQTAEYVKKVEESAYWKFETGFEGAMESLRQHDEKYVQYMKRVERMQYLANTFEYPGLMNETNRMMKAAADDAEQMRQLWAIAKEARDYFAASRLQKWAEVNPDDLEEFAKALQKKLKAGGTKKTKTSAAYKGLDKQIRDFLSTTPLISALRHKSMRPRHWDLLMKATHKTFTPPHEDPDLKLQNLLDLHLHEHAADVEEICDQALKEEKMEETLAKLGETWAQVSFIGEPYKEGSEVHLLKISEDDFETLENDQLAIQNMMASRYLATFEEEVTSWQKSLAMVSDVLTQLTDIQRKWAYLEPLFIASEEVRKELPEDAVRFEKIDRDVKVILQHAWDTKNLKDACNKPELYPELERLQTELDVCEKSLADFLAGKRRQFPRFYFVSKSDLLDILSNGSQPHKILQHITKVFLATETLLLKDTPGDRPTAWRWNSAVGVESVDFEPPVKLEGKVEIYLQTVLDAQKNTLRKALDRSIRRLATQGRVDWLMDKDGEGRPTDPAQLILLASGMEYVKGVEQAFDKLEKGEQAAMTKQLGRVSKDLSDLIRLTQSNLSKGDRARIMCMITLDAHGRDIIQKLVQENVKEKKSFQWQSQLKQRYVNGQATLAIADARFNYYFEYLGNGPRLVVTPLTDRIYVTATQALNLKMGCAPAGPAGTGKTETTKDLANAVAITCYVFNCLAEDHQILTSKGFMFLRELQQYGGGDLLVGGYDHIAKQIVYERPAGVIVNPAQTQRMVEVTHEAEARRWAASSDAYGGSVPEGAADLSNHVSLVVTPNHDMFLRVSSCAADAQSTAVWGSGNDGDPIAKPDGFRKMKAAAILHGDENSAVQMLAHAAGGICTFGNAELPAIPGTELATPEKACAFLGLYGYWVGGGSRGAPHSILFSIAREQDRQWLQDQLATLGLVHGKQWQIEELEGRVAMSVTDAAWVKALSDEHPSKSGRLAPWMWSLGKEMARAVVFGLRRVCGHQTESNEGIVTTSTTFRDELVRLCLHAGYSARFEALRVASGQEADTASISWKVAYADGGEGAKPVLWQKRDIKELSYSGRTWCVTMPHGFVIARRAHAVDGVVTKASIPLIVGNCSPEMDYMSLGSIFKGLSASGSWGCFDEFNRLAPEVLSVCSVQFKAVCDGIRGQRKSVVIEGDEVYLDWAAGAFITMNPGYLGRSELPEGLKSLFRPITVMVPDLVLICENMLMAEGFVEAKILASKFFSLYSLLRELLSKQAHYDWGLRAIKSVLVVAGGFKRAEPGLPEQSLLMRALRDFNTPKIVKQDEVIFFGLLNDLFPGVNPPRKQDLSLEDAVQHACVKRGLDPNDEFRLKVVQLEELLAIRHCVFIMGPPAAGKSQCWYTLQAARSDLKRKTKVVDLDPKAVSPEELYGFIHPQTREWKDGLLSRIMRDLANEPNDDPKWIMLDGDLDANWIESMNSVMDDNKMLTLASNERIPLKAHMRMIFEIRDLNFASPATVSRAGIIYISTNTGSQWRSLINSWLRKLEAAEHIKAALRSLFDRYCAPTLLFIKKECKPMVPVEDVTLVNNLLRLLKVLLTPALMRRLTDPNASPDDAAKTLDTYFVFAAVWAFGSTLSLKDGEDYRVRFSDFWRGEFKTVRMPSRETVFDYWLNPETLQFEQWKNSPHFSVVQYDSKTTAMSQVTVPTPETCSVTYWMELLVNARDPIMLVGYAGCGKTQLVNGLLASQKPEERLSHTINFNFYTDARTLQVNMETPLEKKTGTNFGPPGKAALVYFLDDLNLPEVDKYDTQSAIALVRQHFDYGHWYDRAKLQLRNILNCQYVACMNPTAGSFVINQRLQRHFYTMAIGFPGPTSLHTIYSTFLEGHLKTFPEEIQGMANNLLSAALQLHATMTTAFRKSAQNFHYEFNIRHLSNVFQGLLMANPSEFKDATRFAMLWLHESERVYGDRLVNYEDLGKYKALAAAQAKKKFPGVNLQNFFGDNADPLLFCHFADGIGEKTYDRVTSMEKLRATLDAALVEYNENFAAMNLVLFDDAMRHVCRIARIILNPSGHALLVGVGGSGKQSLSRLAAFICGYRVYQITISGNYSINDLKDDLKAMYNLAGVKEEGVMFLFTDSQITNERFLVAMNDLLASGNIPDLYTTEEVDTIVNSVTPKVKAAGLTPDRPTCWNFFLNLVRHNLHVVLCFSPVGDDFRTRAKKFPALVNCTVIDWFQPWPKEALHSVGVKFLKEVDLGSDAAREGIEKFMPYSFEAVNKMAQKYYQTDRRYVYTTPKSYLELLKLYKKLLETKRKESSAAIERLSNGLRKLRETAAAVAKIEEDLKVKLVAAEEKRATSEAIAAEVAANKTIVESETAKANVLAEECATIATRAAAIREDAEKDLEAAIPAVERAMEALNTLDKKELGECKTMTKPPPGVDDVFAAVVVLLATVHKGVVCAKNGKVKDKDKTWDAAKKALLTDVKVFIEQLMAFKESVDNNELPEGNWKDVRYYLELPHFNSDTIKTKNSAAAGLCSWVVNIVAYHDIVVTVEPKKVKLREANEELAAANNRLAEVREQVATLQAQLDELTVKLSEANAEKAAAIAEVEQGQSKLELANRLTSALADENVRWAAGIDQLDAEKELLVGDVLLASAFISYIGPFTKKYRDMLIKECWMPFLETAAGGQRISMSPHPNPLAILSNDAQIAVWNSQGLPDDKVSIENGCIVTATERWPLMIDPQLQGIAWIREKEKGNGLLVMRLDQKDMLRKLESALERGTPVLIENMGERIDAVLQPVISRALIKKGYKQFLKLGDKEVEFSPKFRLYLHTKLSNPHYPPEIQAETALVNFTVTEAGLEEQLLGLTMQKERPDLAVMKSELIKQQNGFKIRIKELEDGILKRLAEAEGDITEDRELIEGLEKTKRIANDIIEKSAIAKKTEAEINATSEKYRPVAHRAALLFFLMMDLFRVHSYYIYSLNAFVTIFERAIDLVSGDNDPARAVEQLEDGLEGGDDLESSNGPTGGPEAKEADGKEAREEDGAVAAEAKIATPRHVLNDEELVQRCTVLKDSTTRVAFSYVNRGLFEKDKLTVAAQLCFKILVDAGELSEQLVRTLVIGPTGTGDPGSNMGSLAEWLPESVWPKVKALEGVKPVFEKLGDDMQNESYKWRTWFDDEKPETLPLPGEYRHSVSSFHLLLLLRALRPDRLTAALTSFVAEKLGDEFVVQKTFDMSATYAESSVSTPIFFVLFPGVDPTVWIEALGKKLGITTDNGKFLNISMGQGQEAPAMAAMQLYAKNGGWLMLQNVHLMQSWLPTLERQLEMCADTAHADFRCFISAEPPPMSHLKNMPESLMQSCIKVANEAPADLLSNFTRAWANFSQERIDASKKATEFKACLFALCFYHAVVLGRRRFGQQGWSRKYSFNTGDLTVCANVLFDYINNNEVVPWDDLRYVFGEIMYGGHITDSWDRRTNNTYLAVYLRPEILRGMQLSPGFSAPDARKMSFIELDDYITTALPKEGPPMFGLHPNAEIGYLTSYADDLFKTIISLTGGGVASTSAAGNTLRTMLNDLLERLPENFGLIDLEMRAQPLLSHKTAPFVLVALQECTRMNDLLDEIRRSLIELRKGLDGQLNMSEPMEDLAQALSINQVPGRNPFHKCSWERLAWPSRRGLQSWYLDLLRRVDQLARWASTLVTPVSLWLPGIFNPMAFLTAIMQVTARQSGLPLDNMAIETHVTTMLSPEEATSYPEDGMYVHGLFMEGARWAIGDEGGEAYVVGSTACAGHIVDSKLKQLLPALPLVYLKAVPVQAAWVPTSVGFLRQDPAIYDCPVYTTTFRGPTYAFLATLRTLEPAHKWTLAGVAIIMQEDD